MLLVCHKLVGFRVIAGYRLKSCLAVVDQRTLLRAGGHKRVIIIVGRIDVVVVVVVANDFVEEEVRDVVGLVLAHGDAAVGEHGQKAARIEDRLEGEVLVGAEYLVQAELGARLDGSLLHLVALLGLSGRRRLVALAQAEYAGHLLVEAQVVVGRRVAEAEMSARARAAAVAAAVRAHYVKVSAGEVGAELADAVEHAVVGVRVAGDLQGEMRLARDELHGRAAVVGRLDDVAVLGGAAEHRAVEHVGEVDHVVAADQAARLVRQRVRYLVHVGGHSRDTSLPCFFFLSIQKDGKKNRII